MVEVLNQKDAEDFDNNIINKSLTERLDYFKPSDFLYEDKQNNMQIDIDLYITAFKKIFDVKTFRTEDQCDNPEMYLYGDGYFIKGAQSYFEETNHKTFGTRMKKRLNAEFRQKLQANSYVDPDYFEHFDPRYLNVQNGVLDLKTRELLPHDPKYRMKTIIPVDYDPDIDYDFMSDFVSKIVENSDELVIQEMFGDCLWRDYWLQKALMLTGQGANGKGVLLHCLSELLGRNNISSINLVSLTNSKFKTAELHHKFANISNETPIGKLASTDMFKSLRGGDIITAERKYGHPFQFINYAKMIFASNEMPLSSDDTYAFWRSWIIVKFPYSFIGKLANKNLKYELTSPERLQGILNYALDGLSRLLENNDFSYSKSTREVKNEWKKSADSVLTYMRYCLEEDKNSKVGTMEIKDNYFRFCSANGLSSTSIIGFWKKWNVHVTKLFPDAEKKQKSGGGSGTYYIKGIRLKDIE